MSASGSPARASRDGWVAFAGYLLLSLVLFGRALAVDEVIASGDALFHSLPMRAYVGQYLRGGLPQWLPYEFAGLPLPGLLENGCWYPLNIPYAFVDPLRVYNLSLILHHTLCGFFTFLYVRCAGARPLPAFLGGCVFGLGGAVMGHEMHVATSNSVTWLPLLLYLCERQRQEGPSGRLVGAASLVVAVQVLAGGYQVCVYAYLLMLGYATLPLVTHGRRGVARSLSMALPIALGSLIALPQVWSTHEVASMSWRVQQGAAYYAEYSLPLFGTVLLMCPFLFSRAYGADWFGPWNLNEMSGFAGMLALFIAVWWAWRRSRTDVRVAYWTVVMVASFAWALGDSTPLFRLLVHVPVVSLFRVPARHLLEFDLAVAALFSLGLTHLCAARGRDDLAAVRRACGWAAVAIVAAVVVAKGILSSSMSDLLSLAGRQVVSVTFSRHNPAVMIPLGFALTYAAVLALFRDTCEATWKQTVIATLVVAEMLSFAAFVDRGWAPRTAVEAMFDNPLSAYLKEHGAERVAGPSLSTSFYVSSNIGCINALDSLNPNDLYTLLANQPVDRSSKIKKWMALLDNNLLLSTLGARYIVWEGVCPYIERPDRAVPWRVVPLATREVSVASDATVLEVEEPLEAGTYCLVEGEAAVSGAPSFQVYGGTDAFVDDTLDLPVDGRPATDVAPWSRLVAVERRIATPRLRIHGGAVPVRNVRVSRIEGYPVPGAEAYRRCLQVGGFTVYENLRCGPVAWFAGSSRAAASLDQVSEAFYLRRVDPSQTVLLHDGEAGGSAARGRVRVVSRAPDRTELACTSEGAGYVVLADQHFPGWTCSVDGRPTPIQRANGFMMAVPVTSGSHELVFAYRPTFVRLLPVSAGALLLCVLLVAVRWPRGAAALAPGVDVEREGDGRPPARADES